MAKAMEALGMIETKGFVALIEAADSAMYLVKGRGKNGIQVAPSLTDK